MRRTAIAIQQPLPNNLPRLLRESVNSKRQVLDQGAGGWGLEWAWPRWGKGHAVSLSYVALAKGAMGCLEPTPQPQAGCVLVCSPPKLKYQAKVLLRLKGKRDTQGQSLYEPAFCCRGVERQVSQVARAGWPAGRRSAREAVTRFIRSTVWGGRREGTILHSLWHINKRHEVPSG